MSQRITAQGTRVFILIWFGQLVSFIGSGITSFALDLWVYQRTGSVTQFGLILLFTILPSILLSPLAGALVDHWDRRMVMLLSDSGAGLGSLVIALLVFTNRLEVWHIYIAMAASSAFNAFQWSAYTTATALLVPKKHLGRAIGMIESAEAVVEILSPALAGLLIVTIQIQGVLLIDATTFVYSLITLLLVQFPRIESTTDGKVSIQALLRETAYSWRYITMRPGLLGLLIFFAANNFLEGIINVVVIPLVLAFAPVTVLGTVMSVSGIGMLVGSLIMSIWGGEKSPIYAMLGFTLLGGLCILFAGLRPSVPVFFITGFLYYFGLPVINGSSQIIWQKKVPLHLQGRVFAVRRMIAWALLPFAYLIAGVLADQVFEPLLAVNGLLAASIGQIIGVGPGYGIALLFVVIGMLTVSLTMAGYLYPRLRLLEDELPDAINDPPGAFISENQG